MLAVCLRKTCPSKQYVSPIDGPLPIHRTGQVRRINHLPDTKVVATLPSSYRVDLDSPFARRLDAPGSAEPTASSALCIRIVDLFSGSAPMACQEYRNGHCSALKIQTSA